MDITRDAFARYFETEKLISKERSDWALAKEIFANRIELSRGQIEDIKVKTKEEESKITEADKERAELQASLDKLIEVETLQRERIVQLEARVRALGKKLPPVLLAKVEPLLQRIPKAGIEEKDIEASLSQRFQNVLGVLNETTKFHGDIQKANERREIEPGKEAEVTTLYLGLSTAFYTGTEGTKNSAGIGVPGPDGWKWSPLPEHAKGVTQLMNVYDGKVLAEYVLLPLEVKP